MHNTTTAIAFLVAASAGAQTARGYNLGSPKVNEVALTPSYGYVSSPVGSFDGGGLDLQIHLPTVFFLKLGVKAWQEGNAYTLGLGTAIGLGDGRLTIGLDGTTLDLNGWGFEPQYMLRAAYDHQFASGFRVGAGVSHFLNSSLLGADVTAPTVTVGYKFSANGPLLDLTFSNKDAIVGAPLGDGSFRTALTFTF